MRLIAHNIRVHCDVIKIVVGKNRLCFIFFISILFCSVFANSFPFLSRLPLLEIDENKATKQNSEKTPQDSTPNSSCLNNSAINLFSHFEFFFCAFVIFSRVRFNVFSRRRSSHCISNVNIFGERAN